MTTSRSDAYWRHAAFLLGALHRAKTSAYAAARAEAELRLAELRSDGGLQGDRHGRGEIVHGATFAQTLRTLVALRGIGDERVNWSECNAVLAAFSQAGCASEQAMWVRAIEFALAHLVVKPRRSAGHPHRQPRRRIAARTLGRSPQPEVKRHGR